jgi:hypothetical protein
MRTPIPTPRLIDRRHSDSYAGTTRRVRAAVADAPSLARPSCHSLRRPAPQVASRNRRQKGDGRRLGGESHPGSATRNARSQANSRVRPRIETTTISARGAWSSSGRTTATEAAAQAAAAAGEGLMLAIAQTVIDPLRRGSLVRVDLAGAPMDGMWHAATLGAERSSREASALRRCVTNAGGDAGDRRPSGRRSRGPVSAAGLRDDLSAADSSR